MVTTNGNDNYRTSAEVSAALFSYTVDELGILAEDYDRYEVIGGKLYSSYVPHIDHQKLLSNLVCSFGLYQKANPAGEVVMSPGIIFDSENEVIPDLIFATYETVAKAVVDGRFISAPELVIEILSMNERDIELDRIFKRKLYGNFGVKEYWMIDGFLNVIEVYRLENGKQELVKQYDFNESIETPLLADFSLKLTDIFRS